MDLLSREPVRVKRRERPVPGSIPDVLAMFQSELRFYREIAPVLGVRVPRCYRAEETADGTLLVHGGASAPNMRTGPGGEIALVDWEDVSAAPGSRRPRLACLLR
jgi:hypothetical protein